MAQAALCGFVTLAGENFIIIPQHLPDHENSRSNVEYIVRQHSRRN